MKFNKAEPDITEADGFKAVDSDAFFNELQQDLQHYDQPEPEPEPQAQQPEAGTDQPGPFAPDPQMLRAANQNLSHAIAAAGDKGIAWYLANFVAKNKDTNRYQAKDQEVKDIGNMIFELMPKHKVAAPVWVPLVITIAKVYGDKVDLAAKDAKIAQLEAEKAAQAEEIERMALKLKKIKMRKEIKKAAQQ
jgi:hypothetical protein